MKRLLINGKLAVIEADQYFPFTYKISDLEDINIVNFPSTKSFMLPRNTQNDDLFGHIAEITRLNFGYENNLSGVSFNQFKKATYELQYGSKTISEGILRIVNITEDNYEVELYDRAIELLEELEDRELKDLKIINPQTGLPFSVRINHEAIKDMTIKDYGVKPVFLSSDDKYNSIYSATKTDQSVSFRVRDLPEEMSSLQLKTFPASKVPLVIGLPKLINTIETNGTYVEFSPTVKEHLSKLYMLLNKPKNKLLSEDIPLKQAVRNNPNLGESSQGYWTAVNTLDVKRTDGSNVKVYNGNYFIKNDYKLEFTTDASQSNGIITIYNGATFNSSTPEGTIVGEFSVESQLIRTLKAGNKFFHPTINTRIYLIYGENCWWQAGKLTVEGSYIITTEINTNNLAGDTLIVTNKVRNSPSSNSKTLPFGYKTGFGANFTLDSTLTIKPLDYTEYDLLTSDMLLPSMSIKDFILDIAKIFNFNISVKDKVLYIDVKRYEKALEPLLLDDELDIDVSKVNFSRLEIKSDTISSPLIDEYEEEFDTWASKIINTGYTIKKEDEEMELPYGTPVSIIDYNYFAYDLFGGYLNGGYNRFPTGNVEGLEEGLVLGYINNNAEDMYVTDSYYKDGETTIHNTNLLYTPEDGPLYWTFTNDNRDYVSKLESYDTLSPYRFDADNNIVESLEVNKPHYNFANITDAQYPESATLYNRYHKRMLEDKFSADTHVLTGKMFVDSWDVTSKIYNYKNSNYIVSELTEYDPTEPNMYDVKLMRVNNIESYTTLPETPVVLPLKYNNIFVCGIGSYFQGDIRPYKDKIKSFDRQIELSINNGPFNIVQDITALKPDFEYINGETIVRDSTQYVGNWDANNTYRVRTKQQLNYATDTTSGVIAISDSPILTLEPSSTIGGTWHIDNSPETIELGSGVSYSLTEDITIEKFIKDSISSYGNQYIIEASFELKNGTSELHYADIEVLDLEIGGIGVHSAPDNIYYYTSNINGGILVNMQISVYVSTPQYNIDVNDVSVRMMEINDQSISIIPSNMGNINVKGGFAGDVEAIASPMVFMPRILDNITGNTSSTSESINYKSTRLSYVNLVNTK